MTAGAGRLCQDTMFCIVTEGKEWLLKIVLQYKYCIAGWEDWVVLQGLLCCIAIQVLYCRLGRVGGMSRYT